MPSISKAIAAMDKACRVLSVGYEAYLHPYPLY